MRNIAAIFFLLLSYPSFAQYSSLRDSSVRGLMPGVSYAYQWPVGIMSQRFGSNGQLGGEFQIKTRSNFTFGVGGGFLFGRIVKEDGFIDSLSDVDGFLIGYNGLYSNVALFERGYTLEANVGKILPLLNPNPNSGLYVRLGTGFMQHRIRITDTEDNFFQVQGEYAKLYDRLTNGVMLSQYIGYLNIDPKHLMNFHAGILFQEAFTQNRRSWNADQRRRDDTNRVDILIGIRGTWMLPFFGKREERTYTH